MSVYTLKFEPYDPAAFKQAKGPEEIPAAARFWRWLYMAFHYRFLDQTAGVARPLVKIGNDPVRMDAALTLVKFFKDSREEVPSEGGGPASWRLRPAGFSTTIGQGELTMLEEHWKAYAAELLGASDAETLQFIDAQFAAVKATKHEEEKGKS